MEHLDILCLNRADKIYFKEPPKQLVRRLFEQYSHSFYNYSENLILYYLYKRH